MMFAEWHHLLKTYHTPIKTKYLCSIENVCFVIYLTMDNKIQTTAININLWIHHLNFCATPSQYCDQTKRSIKANEKPVNIEFLRIVEAGLTIRPHAFINITIYVFHSNASRKKSSLSLSSIHACFQLQSIDLFYRLRTTWLVVHREFTQVLTILRIERAVSVGCY